ncbi:MAG TPA: radical SAM protein, partial [Vicinamibacterales bacterium]|nr:radical SAM protein [Vicinamibacterales bacterium]
MKLVPRLREAVAQRARRVPAITGLLARYRKHRYEGRIDEFIQKKDGFAGRLPSGVVYEATMRCNLTCEFCYVGDLLNIEGEWRQEMPLDLLKKAFPDQQGLQVSLTGGEIFMRKDILGVMEAFHDKGYVCGYLTTNGTIINPERAAALAELAGKGFLKHISV